MKKYLLIFIASFVFTLNAFAQSQDTVYVSVDSCNVAEQTVVGVADTLSLKSTMVQDVKPWVTPYALPYNWYNENPSWHRMWINTAVLSGAFVGTLLVLQVLPEDATAWNREEITSVPPFKRWFRNIFKRGPEWDHDNVVFNYVLHPYAGMVYFMGARSCGFGFWGSMLYSAAISTIGWEFGIEAFMERPSYQDLVVTPVVGSVLGELCYKGKRTIVNNGYELLGSSALGHIACFLIDPVNEVIDLFRGNPAKEVARRNRTEATFAPNPRGFTLAVNF